MYYLKQLYVEKMCCVLIRMSQVICEFDKLGRLMVFRVNARGKKTRISQAEGFRCANLQMCPNAKKQSACPKVIDNASYPCRKKRTVFGTRAEFLEFVDLKKTRRTTGKKVSRRKKVKKANKQLKKAKTVTRKRKVRFAI